MDTGVLLVGYGLLLVILCTILYMIWNVAAYISTALGLTGFIWWCFTIVIFLMINKLTSPNISRGEAAQ